MEHTVAGAIKEWRKHNKVIGQVKISYKKILRKCRELSLAGGKYREYQGLCAKYQCARLTAVTKGLVPFEDKPFKAYLNKRLSKRRKLDIAHGSLNFIEKTFHPDVLPQLYNVADFGREMFSIPLKMAISLTLSCWPRRFRRKGS
ncbi:putative enzyme [Klebsiella pneumoniae]|nr:putative enzyme [Klebsiella pneumoniae]